jgi:tRNA-2-methylthio-N6-dimethylallyladenosine synthase
MNAKVYIETFGCQMNVADSERAATNLKKAGYEITRTAEAADVVLLNTCSVRERAERKVFTRIGELRQAPNGKQPLIGVMGCVAQLEGDAIFRNSPAVRMVIGTRATDRLPLLIERAERGEAAVLDLGERAEGESWDVSTAERHSRYVAFVPIIEGCNKFCSFCIVPYSRGREKSRLASEIIAEVRNLRDLGYKEIHLIGQNVNSYRPREDTGLEGYRGATPFCRLLRAVADVGMERIKFTTSFPRDFHPDIVAAIEEQPNLCDWVHLPVQSGSNRVLKGMRRGHKAADYLQKVEAIKRSTRRLSLTSDIIVGFPGETDGDFEETLRLVRQCEYDGLYIFKYSQRPGTPAARLDDDVPHDVKKARFMELENLQRQIQNRIYQTYIGRRVSVLVEGQSARSSHDVTGHSTCHKVVNFAGGPALAGTVKDVFITETKTNSLYGRIDSKRRN